MGAFFPKTRALFPISEKGQARPLPHTAPPPSAPTRACTCFVKNICWSCKIVHKESLRDNNVHLRVCLLVVE